MATLGAPLAGATGALFWTRFFDARSEADLAAGKVVEMIGEDWGIPVWAPGFHQPHIWERPDTGDTRGCDVAIRRDVLGVSDKRNLTTNHIYGAITVSYTHLSLMTEFGISAPTR